MEVKQKIRRQYLVTLEEEEAQDIRLFLDGLQEGDFDAPFKRAGVVNPEKQATIKHAVKDLYLALELVPAVHLEGGTQHS